MSEGDARRHDDGDLPPDPWAGLVDPAPPRPPTGGSAAGWSDPDWTPTGDRPARPPGWHSHPSAGAGAHPDDGGHVPPPRRTVWHHPAIWVALLVLAGVLLFTALLERPEGPSEPGPGAPSPDAVTALVGPRA